MKTLKIIALPLTIAVVMYTYSIYFFLFVFESDKPKIDGNIIKTVEWEIESYGKILTQQDFSSKTVMILFDSKCLPDCPTINYATQSLSINPLSNAKFVFVQLDDETVNLKLPRFDSVLAKVNTTQREHLIEQLGGWISYNQNSDTLEYALKIYILKPGNLLVRTVDINEEVFEFVRFLQAI